MLAHPPGCLRFNYTRRTRPRVHLFPVGCEPPCAAFGGGTYCCRGAWAGRENCVPSKWRVDYTQVFKRAAPHAYSYAFDDAATMPCKGARYDRITFGTTNGGT
ncbi:thaumatin family protein [Streptomyces sp. NPDC004237]|uniref:thaumatin family protein n=1 Tax=Streptomyces sp. NPDC004237 TaxID=3154455 RepID=UPI0033BEB0D8